MLENLKNYVLDYLVRQTYNLRADVSTRQNWLDEDRYSSRSRPIFYHRYTSKSLDVFHRKDRSLDVRLSSAEDKQELSVDAKKKIRDVRTKCSLQIREKTEVIDQELAEELRDNELLVNLSDEDYEFIMQDHKKRCSNLKKKMHAEANREIERIMNSSGSLKEKQEFTSSARQARRDREEIQFLSGIILEEKEMLLQFEEYIQDMSPEEKMSDEDIDRYRTEHIESVKKTLDSKIDVFNSERDRRDRMRRGRRIEVDDELHSKLMNNFILEMRSASVQSSPSVNWARTIKDIDTVFTQTSDWNQFTEIAVQYWSYLAMPSKRMKFLDIISRYASLLIGPMKNEADISFTQEVTTLRTERDELLTAVLKLDEQISRVRIEMKKPVIKPRRGMKVPPVVIPKNYALEEKKPKIRRNMGANGTGMGDIWSSSEEEIIIHD